MICAKKKYLFWQHMLGFTYIDKFSIELHICLTVILAHFLPYHSHTKIGKHMGTLGKLAHIERQSVISIETLCNYTEDIVDLS